MPDWLTSLLNSPMAAIVLRLSLIVLLALVALQILRILIRQVDRRLTHTALNHEHLGRLRTLTQAARSLASILILVIFGLMFLTALNIDIGPLLAGAGLIGLALSLGAQSLIKDFIGGVLIFFEGNFAVGDVIKVGDASGEVERITLRATYLRDFEGRLFTIPNGDIRMMSNMTNDWARAVVDLSVSYEADMSTVIHALEAAAQRAQVDEIIKDDLLELPQAAGWIALKDSTVQVRLTAKTRPGKQWDVTNVLRRYAIEALRAEGVRVGVPT
jgi:moderate conductance mechanosensitive channel